MELLKFILYELNLFVKFVPIGWEEKTKCLQTYKHFKFCKTEKEIPLLVMARHEPSVLTAVRKANNQSYLTIPFIPLQSTDPSCLGKTNKSVALAVSTIMDKA
jgi:hypothetical protein